METASSTTAATITFTFSTTTTATRKWDVKISQIPCHSDFKAPPDCAQYYTGPSGEFTSLNYNQGDGFMQGNYFQGPLGTFRDLQGPFGTFRDGIDFSIHLCYRIITI